MLQMRFRQRIKKKQSATRTLNGETIPPGVYTRLSVNVLRCVYPKRMGTFTQTTAPSSLFFHFFYGETTENSDPLSFHQTVSVHVV